MRINRYIARAGVASRRKSEDIILNGEVVINGEVVKSLAVTVEPGRDIITVKGKKITLPVYRYYQLNKPIGYTCTRSDRFASKTVYDLLPKDATLITIGRLDKNTSGLILVTNDGDFANKIIHPTAKVVKQYEVRTQRKIMANELLLLSGEIRLSDGPTSLTRVTKVNTNTVIVGIEEGRNRIIRRIFEKIGNPVSKLKRLSIGDIKLRAKEGEYLELTQKEIRPYV